MVESPVRIENRAQLISALSEASELEHGLTCWYLFAAFTMKTNSREDITDGQLKAVRRWKRTILDIATQEMLHLALASNLLTAIGAAPHLSRPNLPTSPRMYPPAFRLALTRFSEETLEQFIFVERPEGTTLDDGVGFTSNRRTYRPSRSSDIFASQQDYETVGHLYRGIEDGFRYLTEKYGEELLFVGSPGTQTSEYPRLPGLVAVTDLTSAVQAIQGIVEQGEGGDGGYQRRAC